MEEKKQEAQLSQLSARDDECDAANQVAKPLLSEDVVRSIMRQLF
mgnify:CR=1 FL=1